MVTETAIAAPKGLGALLHERFSRAYGVSGLAAAALGALVLATAVTLHSLTEPYDPTTHFVSGLGWGPNGSKHVFQLGLMAVGVLMAPHILFLAARLRGPEAGPVTRGLAWLGTANLALALLGLLLLAYFCDPAYPDFAGHALGAPLYFWAVFNGVVLFTYAQWRHGVLPRAQLVATGILLVSYAGLAVAGLPLQSAGLNQRVIDSALTYNMTAVERFALVGELHAAAPWLALFEWCVVVSTLLWFGAASLGTLSGVHSSSRWGSPRRDPRRG